MPKLYELAAELEEAIREHVDPETGEVSDEGLQRLAEVEMAFEQKALNVASYIISLRAKADGYKGEAESVMNHAKALKARQRACENQAERLREYIQEFLEDGKTLEDERVRIGWGTATSIEMKVGPYSLPVWARKPPPEPEPSKVAIKERLDDPRHPQHEEAMRLAFVNKRRYVKVK